MSGEPEPLPTWATVSLGHGVTHSRYARHIRIEQPSHSIKGRYTIGPAAPDHHPPLFDPPLEEVTAQASSSASFETKGSAIAVEVWIMGQEHEEGGQGPEGHRRHGSSSTALTNKKQPVSIAAKSYMGRIQVSIPRYTPSRPLHIRGKSHSGSVHIFFPPTFSGLVSWRTESGVLKLSPALRERYVNLGETFKHRGTAMLLAKGQPRPAGSTVGKVKGAVERKGLQPKSSKGGSTSRPITPPDSSTAPSSPTSPTATLVDQEDSTQGPELGLPAKAAATVVSATGAVTRGDACELITTYGSIFLYEVGEKPAGSAKESCLLM